VIAGRSSTRELSMAKSRKEKMQLLANLLAEYAAFQRRRPDLLKAICVTCRNKNWISWSPNFSATGRLKQRNPIQRHHDLCFIEG
jgi:hypothetical protein